MARSTRGAGAKHVGGWQILLALASLLASGCTQVSTPTATEAVIGESAPVGSPGEARLPQVAGPPQELEAGTYLTPEGFEPTVSVTVPEGWYGGAGSSGFGVGQGLDEVNERFADVGLFLDVLQLGYAEATAAFQEIPGLNQVEPQTGTVGGHEATIFEASTAGAQVLLDPIAPGVDLSPAAYQQFFVDVDGTTILIRTEVFDESAQPALQSVLDSIEFPEA